MVNSEEYQRIIQEERETILEMLDETDFLEMDRVSLLEDVDAMIVGDRSDYSYNGWGE